MLGQGNEKAYTFTAGRKRLLVYAALGILLVLYILSAIDSYGKATGTGGFAGTTASVPCIRRPCVIVNDTFYFTTGHTAKAVPEEAYIGDILTSVNETELPEGNFTCNFNATGARVYQLSEDSDIIYLKVKERKVILEFEKE